MQDDDELLDRVAGLRGWVPSGAVGGKFAAVGLVSGGGASGVRAELRESARRFWAYFRVCLVCLGYFGGVSWWLCQYRPDRVPGWLSSAFAWGLLAFLVGAAMGIMAILPGLNWLSLKRLSRPPSASELRQLGL